MVDVLVASRVPTAGGGGRVPGKRSRVWMIFWGVSVVLFFVSQAFPAFYSQRAGGGTVEGVWGFNCFVLGWMGPLDGIFAWLANPVLLVVWVLMWFRWGRVVGLAGVVAAVLIGLSFLMNKSIMADEGGTRAAIVGYGAAYWMWLGSMGAAGVGCVVGLV